MSNSDAIARYYDVLSALDDELSRLSGIGFTTSDRFRRTHDECATHVIHEALAGAMLSETGYRCWAIVPWSDEGCAFINESDDMLELRKSVNQRHEEYLEAVTKAKLRIIAVLRDVFPAADARANAMADLAKQASMIMESARSEIHRKQHNVESAIRDAVARLLPGVCLSGVAVRRGETPCTGGVYFFVTREGVLDYIGQSVNIRQRTSPTHTAWKTGNTVAWIDCEDNRERLDLEASLIRQFTPPMNTVHCPKPGWVAA